MAHIAIEYVIMVPILIMQIFLFPLTAGWLMNIWTDSRRTQAIKDAASNLGSTIQQLYFALNHESISNGRATYSPGLPQFIEDHHYSANATLRTVTGQSNSSKILDIMLMLIGTKMAVTTSVVLGPSAQWQESTFMSNSTHACITAEKSSSSGTTTVTIWFGE